MKRTPIIATAAAALLALTTTAWAQPPYQVTVGSASSGIFEMEGEAELVTLAANGPGGIIIWGCDGLAWDGSVAAGASPDRAIGSITDTDWISCIAWGGIWLEFEQIGDWSFNLNGDATSNQIDGDIDDIEVHVTDAATGGLVCRFNIEGRVEGYLDQNTQQFVIDETGFTGNLSITSATGCLGQVAAGNEVDLGMTIDLAFEAGGDPAGPISVSPAPTQPPYNVSVDGTSNGTFAMEGQAVDGTTSTVDGPSGSVVGGCDDLNWTGSITTGSITDGRIGSIADTTWLDCPGPGGIPLAFEQISDWQLNLTGDATTARVDGHLGDIEVHVADHVTGGLVCEATIRGQADGYLDQATQQFVIEEVGSTGNLVLSDVAGCLGQWTDGNEMNLEAVIDLSLFDSSGDLTGPITVSP